MTVLLLAGTTPVLAQTQTTPAPAAPAEQADPAPSVAAPTAPAPSAGGSVQPAPASPAAPEPVASATPAPNASALLPHDLSPWKMFLQADIIVKAVMVGLAFASLVTWTVWLVKSLELLAARRRARRGLDVLERANGLVSAGEQFAQFGNRGPVADLVGTALREAERSRDLSVDGVKERVSIALSRIEARAGRAMAQGTGLLATIGSTAPFVGLFGTVWGIMNSFIGISIAKTTNLAVVAPGIAEALLATAIGLVAAIPAVIIYNVFARSIAGYRAQLSDASAQVLQHLSRDLERHARQDDRFSLARAAE